ncbi:MAG: LysR family transcriptional regulator [Robiginitomaculum sp.]|nr:MAG: LysR family transcriptional regulator [Robiginitomaculum sp.]
MKTLPTVRQMQYLLALADTLHFGEAAQKCFVTQSTLSAGIRDLETLLNVQLFERTKRIVRLTADGHQMVARAKTIIQLTTDLSDAAASTHPLRGPLRLGIIPTIAPYLLPHTLPGIRRQYPELELILVEDESANIVAQLQAGELDVILYALPFPSAGLHNQQIQTDSFYLTVPADHPLANRTSVSIADFADEPMLLLNQGHCLREHAMDACKLQGGAPTNGFSGTSLQTIVQMVAGGLGITILPEMAVASGLAAQVGLKTIALSGTSSARNIAMAWREISPRKEEFTLLSGLFQTERLA